MQLHFIDIAIIVIYLLGTIVIGIVVSKKASTDLGSYFLGGNNIPWYVLGISNASGMFDVSGTMWLVYLCFVYGLKSVFIPWLWPIFNQIFLMVFLSVWLRRSNAMTGAEWIKSRFGTGRGAELSHIIIVIFAIVGVIGFTAYGFKGIGKFSAAFLPFGWSPDSYALIITVITTFYVIKGGMYSVVLTELMQFFVMTFGSIAIGIIAINMVSPEQLAAVVPSGWTDIFFSWKLDLNWSNLIPAVNTKMQNDGYGLFGIFFMMMLFKGVLLSMAGPAPNYDMQRILAAKKPSEAAKMSGFVNIVLFFPRYMMIAGFTVLALVYFSDDLRSMGNSIDLEMILPYALKNFIPTGLLGLVIAGLLAAFMSTYAATVNAAPAYIVNDIYKKYINPNADNKKLMRITYIASISVVVVGTIVGYFLESIDSITQWIVSAFYGGYTASNLLKWYWWRFNSYGYFWGMLVGIVSSLVFPIVFPTGDPLLLGFPFIFGMSLIASIVGSLTTQPDEESVLRDFYIKVRPWGFWGPVHDKIKAEHPSFEKNKDFKIDAFNVVIGIIWQTSLVVSPIYMVIQEFGYLGISGGICLVTTFILKKNWYDRLKYLDEPLTVGAKLTEKETVAEKSASPGKVKLEIAG